MSSDETPGSGPAELARQLRAAAEADAGLGRAGGLRDAVLAPAGGVTTGRRR